MPVSSLSHLLTPSWVYFTCFDHSFLAPCIPGRLTDDAHPPCCAVQISMLWNWYTTDGASTVSLLPRLTKTPAHYYSTMVRTACFLTSSWRVRGVGDYVGSLIGVRSHSLPPPPATKGKALTTVSLVQIFFMVVALEGVRRLSRVYDRRIRLAYYRREAAALQNLAQNTLKGEVPEPAPFR